MSKDIKEKVLEILSNHQTGILSSVENNKPHSRFMTFFHHHFTLYTPTKKDTEKLEEIEKNSAVAVLLGYEDEGIGDAHIEISGTASIRDSQELKKKYWDESFNKYFSGPEDPNFVFLQIEPEIVRLLNEVGEPPQELRL